MKLDQGSVTSSKALVLSVLAIVLTASIGAAFYYPGSKILFITFCALSIATVHAALINRAGSYFAFFLFAFLTLGCWAKLVLHLYLSNDFIEPVGDFDESPAAWDRAVTVLITAFAALLLCFYLVSSTIQPRREREISVVSSEWLTKLLALAILATLGLLGFNYYFSILKIGYEPTLRLNSYVYVVVAFMVAWGNAIAISTIAYWMVEYRKIPPSALFYLAIVEGGLTAISMGSRAQMILHVAVPFAVYLLQGRRLGWRFSALQWIKILGATALMFIFSILAVSADRLASFAQAIPFTDKPVEMHELRAGSADQTAGQSSSQVSPRRIQAPKPPPRLNLNTEQKAKLITQEISKLVVDRWVGIEGVLAVTSAQSLGTDLFRDGLKEDPARGTQAIYQRMSDAKYERFENFTFMTIPGPVAVLFYSGSYLVLFGGISLLFLLGYSIELAAREYLSNVMTSATVGVALAYLVVQMNFPRAFWFFVIELVAFLVGLLALKWILRKIGKRSTSTETI
ncbi:hypothetical protein [Pseudomonas prosekii]|uniref:hypothetical protein n=1 Tax=Pseudomonas prosekii TaxID=1148509 RepID=UPI003F753CC0